MKSAAADAASSATRPGTGPENPTMLPSSLTAELEEAGSGRAPRTTRDWIVDVICFVLATGVAALLFVAASSEQQGAGNGQDYLPIPLPRVDVAMAVLACLSLWWRRRWPVTIAVVLGLMGIVFILPVAAGSIALFTVSVHRRAVVAVVVAAVHLVASLPYTFLYHNPTSPDWVDAAVAAVAIALIVAWGMTVRARRQLVVSLRDRAQRAEAEQRLRAEQARRAERTRIAREMHDVLAHRISLLSTYAGALEFRKDASPDEVARAAGVMRSSAHQALQDLREVIGVLREDGSGDDPERPQPTIAELPGLVEESRRAGTRVNWENRVDDLTEVPAGAGRNVYRIVQEGLTNVRKHARDTTVDLVLEGSAGAGLTVEIRNRLPVGQAASAIPGAGSGLVGIAERANLAGGTLEHGRTPEGDFRLRAWLPWPA